MIDSSRVEEIYTECFDKNGDIEIESVAGSVTFSSEKLEACKTEISEMLAQISDDFRKTGGGGMSLINGCVDKNGRQWTDLQSTVEKMFLLGIGMDLVKYMLPKKAWEFLLGGMPYYVIL